MTKHYYNGITAVFLPTEQVAYRLKALAEAIPELNVCLKDKSDQAFDDLWDPMHNPAFEAVKAGAALFSPDLATMPRGLENVNFYHELQIDSRDVNFVEHVELYIPIVSTDEKLSKQMAERTLFSVMLALFGEHIRAYRVKSGTSEDQFKDLPVEHLYGDDYFDNGLF